MSVPERFIVFRDFAKMTTLTDTLKAMGITIKDNNGMITCNYDMSSAKTYSNKCFLIAVADNIMDIYPGRYTRDNLLKILINYAKGTGVGDNEMIDTSNPIHMDMIQDIEILFNVEIHVRASLNGAIGYINSSRPIRDGSVVNLLCLTDVPGDVKYGHFVAVSFHDDLGGFI